MDNWRELKMMTRALSDVARLIIVYHLARQEAMTVTRLTELLQISQPLVSWHLRKLRRAGLVTTRRLGRQVYCSLNKERFAFCVQRLNSLIDPTTLIESLPTGASLVETEALLED